MLRSRAKYSLGSKASMAPTLLWEALVQWPHCHLEGYQPAAYWLPLAKLASVQLAVQVQAVDVVAPHVVVDVAVVAVAVAVAVVCFLRPLIPADRAHQCQQHDSDERLAVQSAMR